MNRDKNGRFARQTVKTKDNKFIITLENRPETFETSSQALLDVLYGEMGAAFYKLFLKKAVNRWGFEAFKKYLPEEVQSQIIKNS